MVVLCLPSGRGSRGDGGGKQTAAYLSQTICGGVGGVGGFDEGDAVVRDSLQCMNNYIASKIQVFLYHDS